MDPEDIMLSEKARERQILHDFTYMWNQANKTKLRFTENRLVAAIGKGYCGEGEMRSGSKHTNFQL